MNEMLNPFVREIDKLKADNKRLRELAGELYKNVIFLNQHHSHELTRTFINDLEQRLKDEGVIK